jgi:type II secretory pathway component PulM
MPLGPRVRAARLAAQRLWHSRPRRERALLLLLAVGLLAAMSWYHVWQPWNRWRTASERALWAQRLRADELDLIEREILRLRQLPRVPRLDATLVADELARRARAAQVELSSCLPRPDGKGLACQAGAAFDQWVGLLAALQTPPALELGDWRAEPAGESGRVRLWFDIHWGRP